MLTKQQIKNLKVTDLPQLYTDLTSDIATAELSEILKSLGRLPDGFDGTYLLPFLQHERSEIRLLTVKNIGKLGDDRFLQPVYELIQQENDSMTRREAVSAIGRMRSQKAIPVLTELLSDIDPKVVLQAVRGLLVFKKDEGVVEILRQLNDHPNEMIQTVFEKEFGDDSANTPDKTHPVSPDLLKNVAVLGDVRDVLQYVPNESIHLTFTSPPYYNARDYSIYQSYNAYLDFLTDVFKEVHRVTKEGRFFILNTSPVIVPRIGRSYSSKRYPIPFDIHPRLVEMGWEFIDDIVWAKPEASVKNRNAGFLQHRKPLGYKPNCTTEYLMVYRKQTTKLLDWNMRQYDWETIERSRVQGDYETSNLWQIDPRWDKVHSAVFPPELCYRVVTYYSFIGDLVFDPFGGSGTLGRVAYDLERHYFLTEQQPKYFKLMKENLKNPSLYNRSKMYFLTLEKFKERWEQET